MMSIAAGLGPSQEIYSIDEALLASQAFAAIWSSGSGCPRTHIAVDRHPHGHRHRVNEDLGQAGESHSRICRPQAGQLPDGACADVQSCWGLRAADLDAMLQATDVGEVWVIGRRIAKQLRDEGVVNVLHLVQIDLATIRRRWSVECPSRQSCLAHRGRLRRRAFHH